MRPEAPSLNTQGRRSLMCDPRGGRQGGWGREWAVEAAAALRAVSSLCSLDLGYVHLRNSPLLRFLRAVETLPATLSFSLTRAQTGR